MRDEEGGRGAERSSSGRLWRRRETWHAALPCCARFQAKMGLSGALANSPSVFQNAGIAAASSQLGTCNMPCGMAQCLGSLVSCLGCQYF